MASPPCPHCGAVTEAEARFCGVCGGKLEPPAKSTGAGAAGSDGASVELHAMKTLAAPPADLPAPVASPSARLHGGAKVPSPASKPIPASPKPAGGGAVPQAVAREASKPAASKPATTLPAPSGGPQAPSAFAPPSPEEIEAASQVPKKRQPLEKLIGRTLNGRYLVEKKIGEGGFGAVFRGKQVATGREVAIKMLHPHNVSDATVVARFRREAEACSKLTNPHCVTIYDFDETEDGVLYLAMELLRGRPLQEVQRDEGPLSPLRVMGVLAQVAEALAEAHKQGIVHRDMKPENVMIESRNGEDFVKVLDFGIAKMVEQPGRAVPALTAVGQTLGTLEFMSPEQLRGRPLDGRSDIYALGMMAYEMLAGELPFKSAKSSTEVIQFHLQTSPPPPSSLRPDLRIPGEVDAVVLKMVAKSREDRFSDADDLRKHIVEVAAAGDRTVTRHEALRVVAVVGGLAALVAAIIFFASR